MKKVLLILALVVSATIAHAQDAQFKWKKTFHDFGKFKEGTTQTVEFEFTNSGQKPLIVYKASTSCGCTKATWPKQPIKPGGSGTIVVTYDSKDKPYPFQKSIWVMSNASNGSKKNNVELRIKGVAE